MQLVTEIVASNIVTNLGTIAQTEALTGLLADAHALGRGSKTIVLLKFIGVGKRLDGGTELLGGVQRQVVHVVGVLLLSLSARRRLGNVSQTVPSNAVGILASIGDLVQNTVVNASLITMLTNGIPN